MTLEKKKIFHFISFLLLLWQRMADVDGDRGERPLGPGMSASLPSLFRSTGSANLPSPIGPATGERHRMAGLVSTECQTDSRNRQRPVSSGVNEVATPADANQDDQQPIRQRRRREKRRRRPPPTTTSVRSQPIQQHVQQLVLEQQTDVLGGLVAAGQQPVSPSGSDHLPDILNAHMPPPYSTLPHNSERCMGMGPLPAAVMTALPVPAVTAVPGPSGATATALMAANSFSLPPPGGRR